MDLASAPRHVGAPGSDLSATRHDGPPTARSERRGGVLAVVGAAGVGAAAVGLAWQAGGGVDAVTIAGGTLGVLVGLLCYWRRRSSR